MGGHLPTVRIKGPWLQKSKTGAEQILPKV